MKPFIASAARIAQSTLFFLAGLLALPTSAVTPDLPRLDVSALRYAGSFLVPFQDRLGINMTYGGYALGVDSPRNGLYFGCHDYLQRLAEVEIPPVGGPTAHTATILQDCTDVAEGRLAETDSYLPRLGGSLLHNGRLIVSGYGDYDADHSQVLSHFVASPDFAVVGEVQGPFQVGNRAGFVAGYMTPIPPEWREDFGGPSLTGQCCINIISRSSAGPSASVFNPDTLGNAFPVPATMLVGYPLEHALADPAGQNSLFNHSTRIAGLAFPPGSRSILFIGRHGVGPYCYDTAEACGDPFDAYKGPHAQPYVHQVWAYDALDLLKVRRGELQPWEVHPYAVWRLPEMDQSGAASIAGATYDPVLGRLYVTEIFGEDANGHRVHVYQVDVPAQRATVQQVQKAYIAYYGRPADPEGLAYWANRMDREGGSLVAIISAFGNSDEYSRRYSGSSNIELVSNIYRQLLGREPDEGGLAWYVARLDSGAMTLTTIALNVIDGATTKPDADVVANKMDAANHYTAKVAAGCDYGGELAGVSSLAPVTDDLATVWSAMGTVDSRCGS